MIKDLILELYEVRVSLVDHPLGLSSVAVHCDVINGVLRGANRATLLWHARRLPELDLQIDISHRPEINERGETDPAPARIARSGESLVDTRTGTRLVDCW